jgi:hypothetical protein
VSRVTAQQPSASSSLASRSMGSRPGQLGYPDPLHRPSDPQVGVANPLNRSSDLQVGVPRPAVAETCEAG